MVEMVGMFGTVSWQHVLVWQGFCHYGRGWSSIRELAAVAIAYS